MKLFKKEKAKISYAFLLSLAIHIGVTALFIREVHKSQETTAALPSKTQVATLKLENIKFISPKMLKAIKDSQSKQIVANETNGRVERPKNSRFAGEKDQTFDRQTMARTNGAFKEAGLGQKTGSNETLAQVPKKVQPEIKKPATAPAKKNLSLSDLGGFELAKVEKAHEAAAAEEKAILDEMAEKTKSAQALGLEKGKAGTNGLSASNDFVEDVPLGDMTNLNTTENMYYGFYHRIRQKLEQHWGTSIKDKAKNLYRSGRRMPASENLITAVTVILNDRGNIVDIKIEGTSGIRELDQAAIESFNKAGPFPNPPKGLLVGGRATIQWGFVVKS